MTVVMEDEVLAEQGEEASLLAGCRSLLRAVTKVRTEKRCINIHEDRCNAKQRKELKLSSSSRVP